MNEDAALKKALEDSVLESVPPRWNSVTKKWIGVWATKVDVVLGEDGIKVRDSFGNQDDASIGDLNASQDIQIKSLEKPREN